MVLSYILFTILGLALAGYYVWNRWYNPEPVTLNSLLINNAANTFKMLGAASTFVEIVNLSLNDMQINGADPFQAFGRYGLFGVIEILLTFFFISIVEDTMVKAAEDGKITMKEYLGIVIKSAPLFIFGFLATSQIHNFYLWSIYHIEIQQVEPLVWFLPMTGFSVETNPLNFILFDPEWRQPINPATVVLIYSTPAFNFILVFALRYKLIRDIKNGVYDTVEDADLEDLDDDDDHDDDEDNNDDDKKKDRNLDKKGLQKYTDELYSWFGITEESFSNWLSKYIGTDINTGKEHIDSRITNPDVVNGDATSQEILIEITDKLVGVARKNNYTGLAGIKRLTDNVSALVTRYKNLQSENKKREDEREEKRKRGESVGDLTVTINDFKKDLNLVKDDILEELEYRKGIQKEFTNILDGLNYKVPHYVDEFEHKVKNEL